MSYAMLLVCGFIGKACLLVVGSDVVTWKLNLYHWQVGLSAYFCCSLLLFGVALAVRRCSEYAQNNMIQVLYAFAYLILCIGVGYLGILGLGYIAVTIQWLAGTDVTWVPGKEHYVLGCEFYLVLGASTHVLRRMRWRHAQRLRGNRRNEEDEDDDEEMEDVERGQGGQREEEQQRQANAANADDDRDTGLMGWLKRGLVHEWSFPMSCAVVCVAGVITIVCAGYVGKLVHAWTRGRTSINTGIDFHHLDLGFFLLTCVTIVSMVCYWLQKRYQRWRAQNLVVVMHVDRHNAPAANYQANDPPRN